jgi:hypothetical protein
MSTLKNALCYTFGSMAAKQTTLKEVGDMLSHVVEHMATKDDLATVKNEFKGDIAKVGVQVASIEQELKTIRRELGKLLDDMHNVAGYRKEIDYALERIAAIEQHLLKPKRA